MNRSASSAPSGVGPRAFAARFWRNRRGATAVVVGLLMPFIIGMAGFVVDVGHIIYVQRQLQAATDAAALAGAHDINCCSSAPGQAKTTATAYSAVTGDKNQLGGGLSATMLSGYPQLKCFASTGVSCTGSDNANGIVVKEQTVVPTWFASVLGFKNFTVAATSTAGAQGGPPKQLDIMLVLDTTASMAQSDTSCSISGATKLACAEAGARTLLTSLSQQGDQVGLEIYPGVTSATVADEYGCGSKTPKPTIVAYKSSPTYGILALGNDFKASGSTTLNSSSDIIKAVGGVSGCTGLTATGGVGTYFADAIDTAQATLTSTGRTNVQKVMIILSDGDAGSSSAYMTAAKVNNQCAQAVTEAKKATAAGTWVYTIAYGASTSATGSCGTDSPHIAACTTMQNMASNATFFYSDQTGGTSSCTSAAQSTSELVSIFKGIAGSFGTPRLIPDSTT